MLRLADIAPPYQDPMFVVPALAVFLLVALVLIAVVVVRRRARAGKLDGQDDRAD